MRIMNFAAVRLLLLILLAIAALTAHQSLVCAQDAKAESSNAQTASNGELTITGAVKTPLKLAIADLKNMPRTSLSVTNPHNNNEEVYEGVLLEELLRRAGATQGTDLRGPAMATYVLAEAADGYRVIFSLAELDSGISDSNVIVADTMDGKPLSADLGPFRLVAPHEKRPARWIRMLKSITVVRL